MNSKTKSMEEKILGWLKENGYPLEMRIARQLSINEFGVTQSHFYTDFESDTHREIDVIGRLYDYVQPANYFAISELETFCTIECKSSSKPWVVFCETRPSSWNLEQAAANENGRKLLIRARKALGKTKLVKRSLAAGHGIAQAFGGGTDVPYSAVMSSMKAAEAKARESKKQENEIVDDSSTLNYCLSVTAIAAVAISAPLFECRLGDNGEPELQQVQHSALAFRYPRQQKGLKTTSIIHVVTEEGLEEFMNDIRGFHNAAKTELHTLIPPDPDAA